jgi:hypothetical protein
LGSVLGEKRVKWGILGKYVFKKGIFTAAKENPQA